MQNNQTKQAKPNRTLKETYPIVQHTDVILNTNKKETLTFEPQNANYAELINIIKCLLPAMDNFIPKSPEIYKHFYYQKIEINDTFQQETQKQDSGLRQQILWKQYTNLPATHTCTIRDC